MPQDPVLLMSMINMYLRDQYSSLEALCEDKGFDENEVRSRLEAIGYSYQPGINQFR